MRSNLRCPCRPFLALLTPCLVIGCLASIVSADVVVTGTDARFIRVRNNGTTSRRLHIGEIEAFLFGVTPAAGLDGTNDRALTASGASFESRYGPLQHGTNAAVFDGDVDTYSNTFSFDPGIASEYVLDLGQTRTLGTVRAWQRGDCCYERLKDFTVSLLAEDGTTGLPGEQVGSALFPTQVPNSNFGAIDFSGLDIRPGGPGTLGTENVNAAVARFLSVKNNGIVSRRLHLGEIEAFSTGRTPAAALDPVNDLAWVKKGASFESEIGSQAGTDGHGSVNAVFDGNMQSGGATWTRTAVGAEYVLDLGQTRNLDTVRLWQRDDICCQDRLSDVIVTALADNGSGQPGTAVSTVAYPGQAPNRSFAPVSMASDANQFMIGTHDRLIVDVDAAAKTSDLLSVGTVGGGELVLQPGASLDVNVIAGTPETGDRYNVIDAGSIQGTFSKTNLPALAGQQFWNLSDLYSDGDIQVSEDVLDQTGIEGRFIRVRNVGPTSRELHLGEIEAFVADAPPTVGVLDNANDVALASAGASHESHFNTIHHGSINAVFNGAQETSSSTFSLVPAVGAEYVLDLGQTRDLGTLRLWQRGDNCCDGRLSNVIVDVLADDGAGAPGSVVHSENYTGIAPSGGYATFDLPTTLHVGGEDTVGTAVEGDTVARFIRVRNDGGAYRPLHIGEIEAFLNGVTPTPVMDNTDDIALAAKGATFESAAGTGGHGGNGAVLDGLPQTGGSTWTRNAAGAEYVLDLGQEYDLDLIRLWQRTDGCCQGRLSNFTVSLLADDGTGAPGDTVYSESWTGNAPTDSFASFDVQAQVTIEDHQTLSIELDGETLMNDVFLVGNDGLGELFIEPDAVLDISWLDAMTSSMTAEFDILEFDSVTGQFALINLPTLLPAQFWNLDDLYITGVLRIGVPEPSTWLLMVLGSIGFAAIAHRRRVVGRAISINSSPFSFKPDK